MRHSKDTKSKKLKALGKRIKRARERMKWTQEMLAHKLGYDPSIVSHWEAGKKAPTALTLIELIKKLDLKV